jgi:hypothetical protein
VAADVTPVTVGLLPTDSSWPGVPLGQASTCTQAGSLSRSGCGTGSRRSRRASVQWPGMWVIRVKVMWPSPVHMHRHWQRLRVTGSSESQLHWGHTPMVA